MGATSGTRLYERANHRMSNRIYVILGSGQFDLQFDGPCQVMRELHTASSLQAYMLST
jgi:hypothetical protein